MNIRNLYWNGDLPRFIFEGMRWDELLRLREVGMNCGCEYTSFPLFRSIREPYSRYDHSVGAALLVWRFTRSVAQSFAALFHDVASPCFSHVVDFMRGDHLRQESTEAGTRETIEDAEYLADLLARYGLTPEDVADYHMYPIADNASPRLSADRLEYTCGNLVNYGLRTKKEIRSLVDDLTVGKNEDGEEELVFRSREKALRFAKGALETGRIYVSDEDRFAMQALAALLRDALDAGVITPGDLWKDEPALIAKLCRDPAWKTRWEHFRGYRKILRGSPEGLVIPAKKRYIDPIAEGEGRVSDICPAFREAVEAFLSEPQDIPLAGISAGAAEE